MTRAMTSAGLSATVPWLAMPALAITTSIPPSCATVVATAASSEDWSVTSHSAQQWLPPCCRSSVTSFSSRSGSMPTAAMWAPRAAARRAVSSPMPRAAPVMNRTLFFRLPARSAMGSPRELGGSVSAGWRRAG